MTTKTYPWSAKKYAKDVEYLRNYLYCTVRDEDRARELGPEKIKEIAEYMEGPLADLSAALVGACAAPRGIVWLTGPQIGTAKQAVMWAEEARANANVGLEI